MMGINVRCAKGMILFWFIIACRLSGLNSQSSSVPEFLQRASKEARQEYNALYDQEYNLSKNAFFDLRMKWAKKQGPEVEALFKQYLQQEIAFDQKRYDVLKYRLQKIPGGEEAKKLLYDILEIQHKMNTPISEQQRQIDKLMNSASQKIQDESTNIWNEIHPDQIN